MIVVSCVLAASMGPSMKGTTSHSTSPFSLAGAAIVGTLKPGSRTIAAGTTLEAWNRVVRSS